MTKPYRTLSNNNRPRCDSERAIKLDLESLVSQITRLRIPFCVLCGENNWRELECGHFWHRAMPPTEFDLQNLNTLCKGIIYLTPARKNETIRASKRVARATNSDNPKPQPD